MAGRIATQAPHLDGSEDVGVWFDVAWAAYMDIACMGADFEKVEEAFEKLAEKTDDNGRPTPETWGTSAQAQQAQAGLMAMFGGTPDMGAAPSVGDESGGAF